MLASFSVLGFLVPWLVKEQTWMLLYALTANFQPQPRGYLINTPTCTLPEYDPFHASILPFIKEPSHLDCNPKNLSPLTLTEGFTIRVNSDKDVLKSYGVTETDLSCCFKEITREQEPLAHYTEECDNKYKYSKCFPIDNNSPAPVSADGALVICSDSKNSKPVYKNVHYFFHMAKIQEKIKKFSERQKHGEARPLNLILLGIDSTSRQNFIRYLPKTFKFLSEDPATLDFVGYNKVSDNTDPNVSPIIMGNRAEDLYNFKENCYKSQLDNFDDCPFIWKKFSSKNYATVYVEDAPEIGLFHYRKVGFVNEPTDFYARPYILATEKEIGHSKTVSLNSCYGLQITTEVIYDHIIQALDNISDSIPVFGFFWTGSLTHDLNEPAAALDLPTLNLFQKYFSSRHRNNSIILFFGDHGLRFGNIRSTYLGALEERLPFVRMIFPLWFPEKFKHSWKNLLINQQRLTNNYDLHSTLLDILNGSFEVSGNPTSPHGYGRSLFLEIPDNRTCASAHIPQHYCVCHPSESIEVDDANVIKGALILTDAINKLLSGSPQCAVLELDQIHAARISRISTKSSITLFSNPKDFRMYTLTLQTNPGGGSFEGSVVEKEDGSLHHIDSISRINMYGNQSFCVQDSVLKRFCYCKKFKAEWKRRSPTG
ncbi:Protein of unknown function DUF229 [Trinorchestia longiramus]|nr:Protein of unknown function DUF229 [Trinorchestia longiramus]